MLKHDKCLVVGYILDSDECNDRAGEFNVNSVDANRRVECRKDVMLSRR